MANCVHIKCVPFISCQMVPGATGATDVGECEHCAYAVVFVPGAEPLWITSAGFIRDKVTCRLSPTNKHWVHR